MLYYSIVKKGKNGYEKIIGLLKGLQEGVRVCAAF
jgi:hypothetical protein